MQRGCLMQASSITEALLMSPRSMSSTTTKAVTPATPGPLGPLTPLTRPSHHSPPSPFPLSPLSPGFSPSLAESARQDAHIGKLALNDSTLSHAGHSITSDAGMGAEQMQSGGRLPDSDIISVYFFHFMSFHVISCHFFPFLFFNDVPCRVVWCGVVSFQFISF